MTTDLDNRLTDPVCGMGVRLDAATEDGLVFDHHGTLYAFCRSGCLDAFRADPHRYERAGHASSAETAMATAATQPGALPVVDEGMRRWYDSCSCCLGDAYPEVKAALDAERQATGQPTASDGICEVAEAATTN